MSSMTNLIPIMTYTVASCITEETTRECFNRSGLNLEEFRVVSTGMSKRFEAMASDEKGNITVWSWDSSQGCCWNLVS
jgi:hypothetical protein